MLGRDDAFDGFADYHVTTHETPALYIILVTLAVLLSMLLVVPFAICRAGSAAPKHPDALLSPAPRPPHDTAAASTASSTCSMEGERGGGHPLPITAVTPPTTVVSRPAAATVVADLSIFHRELLNAMKHLATERRYDDGLLVHSAPPPLCYSATMGSAVSLATTSRLRVSNKQRPLRRADPRRHWAVWLERQAAASEGGRSRRESPAVHSFLEEGEQQSLAKVGRWQQYRNYGGSEMGSVLPPLSPSVVSPQDAADANDPGCIPNPTQYYNSTFVSPVEEREWKRRLGLLLDLAEMNFESRRILSLAFGPTINAMAEPLFRMVLVAIISHFIDTDSMVAYVLVILFLRISTIEISGAIADAESNMLQDAFLSGGAAGWYQAGQIMQLSLLMQILIGLPVLLLWFFVMDPLVQWLVDDAHIARVAASYTGVIVIDYLIRSVSRSFMLPFHLTGPAQFEKNIDLLASFFTVVAIAIVAANYNLSLTAIGWIQVILGIAKALTKVAYVVWKGFLAPYHDGLVKSWACKDTSSVVTFLSQALPLFLGSLLELGEWEVLVLFVSHLGGAEVATWAVMGGIWEVLEALTEGLGEAASIRVTYYLTESLPVPARRLAHKVAFLSLILVLVVSSIFLMAGPNIAVTLSTDPTIQHLFTNLVGATSLANASMTFGQIHWSLAGAQGRFGLASATTLLCRWLVVLPLAAMSIFGFTWDLVAVGGAVALGYALAAGLLAYAVHASDWERWAYLVPEEEGYRDEEAMILEEGGEEEDADSESFESQVPSSTVPSDAQHADPRTMMTELDLL